MPIGASIWGPALIGAAGSIGGSLLGKSSINNYQKQAYNLLNSNAQTASGAAPNWFTRGSMFFNQGNNFLNQSRNALQAPTNYFQSLLSGSPSATTSALAPDINRIRGGTQQTLQAESALSPRGGGRSSSLFNLPFQNQSQVSGLFNQMRPMAASNLTGIGGMLGNLGLGTAGVGLGAGQLGAGLLNSSNYAGGLMGNIGGGFANQMAQAAASGGQGISDILNSIKWGQIGKMFGGGGGGGTYNVPDFGGE